MKQTLAALLRMSRPYYVIQAIAPPVAGYLAASRLDFSWVKVLMIGSIFGLLAMSTWVVNDFLDKSADSRGRSKRLYGLYVAGGTGVAFDERLSSWKVAGFVAVLNIAGLALAAAIKPMLLLLACVFALVGTCYSLPPIRLKVRGISGQVATACCYGLAFAAGWVVTETPIPSSAIIFGALMSVLVFGYDGLSHVIDRKDDEANGLGTFAVNLGVSRARQLLAASQILPPALIGFLGLTGHLNVSLASVSLLLTATVLTANVLLFGRERDLWAVRLMSVPLVSAAFFLIV